LVGSLQATLVLFADEGVLKKGAPEVLGGEYPGGPSTVGPCGKAHKYSPG